MERIVYLLGAGFSAPLGLPVMQNFYTRSMDMLDDDKQKYGYFSKVFDAVRNMSPTKTYFDSDLKNIEEILSILDMKDMVSGENQSFMFAKYIKEVIKHHTPTIPAPTVEVTGDSTHGHNLRFALADLEALIRQR